MSALDWSQCPAVESVPGNSDEVWVFRGTRVLAALVFQNLDAGMTIRELLATYEGLTREHISAVLQFAARSMETQVPRASGQSLSHNLIVMNR